MRIIIIIITILVNKKMYYYYAVLSFLLHKLPASRPFRNSLQFIRCFNFLPSFMYTLYMDKLRIFPAHHFKITVVDKSYFFFFKYAAPQSQSFEINFTFLRWQFNKIHTHARGEAINRARHLLLAQQI